MEHSKTPWKPWGSTIISLPEDRTIFEARGNNWLENIDYVVDAVNHFDALKEIVRRFVALEHADGGRSFPTKEDIADARRVLAECEKDE